MTFHLMIVNDTFSSVWVAGWAIFWDKAVHSVGHMFSLYFDYWLF